LSNAVPAVITIPEAAELLRISPSQAYRLAERRELPGARKVGSQWRISRSQLLAGFGLDEVA
jgi:excisionase family DNA binding protein